MQDATGGSKVPFSERLILLLLKSLPDLPHTSKKCALEAVLQFDLFVPSHVAITASAAVSVQTRGVCMLLFFFKKYSEGFQHFLKFLIINCQKRQQK